MIPGGHNLDLTLGRLALVRQVAGADQHVALWQL
jgi:hypothetical protein